MSRAGETRRQLGDVARVSPPEMTHSVAIAAVPLGPPNREVADLVAAGTNVPRLGDELDVGERRILMDDVEERGELVDVVELAREHGREIEPKAVDVHVRDPIAQRVHDELDRARV